MSMQRLEAPLRAAKQETALVLLHKTQVSQMTARGEA